jgi:hypothetical protein
MLSMTFLMTLRALISVFVLENAAARPFSSCFPFLPAAALAAHSALMLVERVVEAVVGPLPSFSNRNVSKSR